MDSKQKANKELKTDRLCGLLDVVETTIPVYNG
jgi:hypothetical protein